MSVRTLTVQVLPMTKWPARGFLNGYVITWRRWCPIRWLTGALGGTGTLARPSCEQ